MKSPATHFVFISSDGLKKKNQQRPRPFQIENEGGSGVELGQNHSGIEARKLSGSILFESHVARER